MKNLEKAYKLASKLEEYCSLRDNDYKPLPEDVLQRLKNGLKELLELISWEDLCNYLKTLRYDSFCNAGYVIKHIEMLRFFAENGRVTVEDCKKNGLDEKELSLDAHMGYLKSGVDGEFIRRYRLTYNGWSQLFSEFTFFIMMCSMEEIANRHGIKR